MTTAQQGFLLSRHSRDHGQHCEISLWVATDDGPAKLVIEDQQPLFFVRQADRAKITDCLLPFSGRYQWRELTLHTFAREPVAGLYFHSLNDSYQAQQQLSAVGLPHFEGDIRLQERYLMERFTHGGLSFVGQANPRGSYTEYRQVRIRPSDYRPRLRLISLDIECSRHGELYSIGFYGEQFERVLMIGQPQPAEPWLHWVDDERALLQALEHTLNDCDPDVIIGWNVVNFDFRLLLKRAEHHGLVLRLGRGRQLASWRDARFETNQGFISLPGRIVIDGIDALKTATYQFASFSLESVARELLGRGKKIDDVAHRLEHIEADFRHNKPKLAAYNLEDCRLVHDIFEHTRIIDFLLFRSQLTGLELDRTGGWVAAFGNLYLPRLHRAGYVAPNLPDGGGLASPGGYVMDSRPGLYKHVLVLDFKSLYPSIIRTFKIDPLGLIEGLRAPEDSIEGFKGAYFSREQHFLPAIITELWQQRDRAKAARDQPRSQAIKLIMNSFYGVLGSGGCRFYDTRLASSITLRGHQLMQDTAARIEQQGYQVIYGDTDSIFVRLSGSYTAAKADALGHDLARDINDYWQQRLQQEFALESHLELEYETHFHRFLMPTIRGADTGSKKRYAGLVHTDAGQRLVFKGLENVRADWTELAKQFQNDLYQLVFSDEDPTTLIRETVEATRNGRHDDKLVYKKRLRRRLDQYVKNIPPHVRAARLADEHLKRQGMPPQYQHKGTIRYLITVNGPEPLEHCPSQIDYQHYIDKQLKPVADAILPFINLSFDELIDQQLGLF